MEFGFSNFKGLVSRGILSLKGQVALFVFVLSGVIIGNMVRFVRISFNQLCFYLLGFDYLGFSQFRFMGGDSIQVM